MNGIFCPVFSGDRNIIYHFYNKIKHKMNRHSRKPEKCHMTQQFCCKAKSVFRRNTVCILREMGEALRQKGKSDGASSVSEDI